MAKGGRTWPKGGADMQTVIFAIKKEIFEIQHKENREDLTFFQIREYNSNGIDPAMFWNALERDLQQKFTKVYNYVEETPGRYKAHWAYGFLTTNNDAYIFLICNERLGNKESCLQDFSGDYSKHTIVKETYSRHPYTIYLTKRETMDNE